MPVPSTVTPDVRPRRPPRVGDIESARAGCGWTVGNIQDNIGQTNCARWAAHPLWIVRRTMVDSPPIGVRRHAAVVGVGSFKHLQPVVEMRKPVADGRKA